MIKVTDDLYIDVQADQCVVFRKTGKLDKDGKEICTDHAYPYDISQALRICLRRELEKELSDKEVELREAIKIIKEIHERFEKILKEHVDDYEKFGK